MKKALAGIPPMPVFVCRSSVQCSAPATKAFINQLLSAADISHTLLPPSDTSTRVRLISTV
jgi:hypothetical protein